MMFLLGNRISSPFWRVVKGDKDIHVLIYTKEMNLHMSYYEVSIEKEVNYRRDHFVWSDLNIIQFFYQISQKATYELVLNKHTKKTDWILFLI